MAQGPPPSEAGSSNASYTTPSSRVTLPSHSSEASQGGSHNTPCTEMSQAPPNQSYYAGLAQNSPQGHGRDPPPPQNHSYHNDLPYVQAPTSTVSPGYGYYSYPPGAWSNAWPIGGYAYGPSAGYSYPSNYQALAAPNSNAEQRLSTAETMAKPKSPTPELPSDHHKHWDSVIKTFLSSAGLTQTLRGFATDMMIMNPDWERKNIPPALGELKKNLEELLKNEDDKDDETEKSSLEERKLDYINFADGVEHRSQTSITKSISRFLSQNRARNDASNRNEFLLSLAEKRRRLNEDGESDSTVSIPSCARTDAKTQDRDIQMKYDIAKNEDGPLRKTMKSQNKPGAADITRPTQTEGEESQVPTAVRYPGLDERLKNIETHVAIRYVPSPPRSLLDRLRFLEDHIINLEKEYPPWAALHFNQPNRGWPPPPRPTPIIVPSHLTSTTLLTHLPISSNPSGAAYAQPSMPPSDPGESNSSLKMKNKPSVRNSKSSLHRAVMERLEVQKAMNDLAGVGDSGGGP